MFLLSAYSQANASNETANWQAAGCILFSCVAPIGAQAAYNALGYALLAGNSLMSAQLSQAAVIQSGVIGTAILTPIGIGINLCMGTHEEKDPNCTLLGCACSIILGSVINSLVGAQIIGLFASNITTPEYIAANGATGAAAFIGGTIATIVVIAGISYFCVALKDNIPAFLPTKCLPKFSAKDLVCPESLGLNICTKEQMLAFLQCCPSIKHNSAPNVAEMVREQSTRAANLTNVNHMPVAELADLNIPMAVAVDEHIPSANLTMASAPAPSTNANLYLDPEEYLAKNKLTPT